MHRSPSANDVSNLPKSKRRITGFLSSPCLPCPWFPLACSLYLLDTPCSHSTSGFSFVMLPHLLLCEQVYFARRWFMTIRACVTKEAVNHMQDTQFALASKHASPNAVPRKDPDSRAQVTDLHQTSSTAVACSRQNSGDAIRMNYQVYNAVIAYSTL